MVFAFFKHPVCIISTTYAKFIYFLLKIKFCNVVIFLVFAPKMIREGR